MKYISLLTFAILASGISVAESATLSVKSETAEKKLEVPYINTASPTDIAKIQNSARREIQFMLDTYSDAELQAYAKRINKQAIKNAKENGKTVPPKLSKEILSDRKKIGEYLRSFYDYEF